MDESAQKLVDGLRRGDPASFEQIYRQFRPRIYSFLARLTRDRSTAEDLFQETWLRLASNALALNPETNLGAWLFSVAHNLFITHQRWRRIRLEHIHILRRGQTDETPTPFDLASAAETERRLEAALGKLSDDYREILLLVCVEGFAPAQAAQILGISPETGRQRLARARGALAKSLEELVAITASVGGNR
jgi:RNA polymerase sigma-70 factor (ECF subfamily)